MTDLPTTAPSRQKLQAKHASKPRKVTGPLKTACDLMVYGNEKGEPLEWNDAAIQAGYSVKSMRSAMERPWVRAYLRAQRQVLCVSLGATNIGHIAALRSSSNQMTRLGAARLIEEIAGTAEALLPSSRPRAPGVIIVIGPAPAPRPSDARLITIGGDDVNAGSVRGSDEDFGES